jgi:glycosyltransferase involved in cell wall biosynthesis
MQIIIYKYSGFSEKIREAINKWFYRHEKVLPVTISQKCYESYESYYGLNNAHCVLNGCPTPIKTDLFQEVTREVDSFKKDTNTPVFIHVARFHPYKNQKLLIESFNRLDSLGVDFVLLIVGDGYDEEGRFLVDSSCDRIHFLGLKRNVTDYLLCSDAFCLTSLNEGLPISLLEALSCGVVPICTKAGGIPDVIEDGVTGMLVKDFDVESYTGCLQKFIGELGLIDRNALKQLFDNQYSMRVCAEKYIAIYEGSR